MIQFARDYSRLDEFVTACSNCQDAEVRIRYQTELCESARGGGYEYHSPEIISQECRCLIGDDFAQDALDDYLERPRRIQHGHQLRLF